MKNALFTAALIYSGMIGSSASAQDAEVSPGHQNIIPTLRHAVGMDVFASTDADDSDVLRAGLNLDLRYQDPEHFLGLRVEKAWYRPLGRSTIEKERIFLRYADAAGDWNWNVHVGTDGDTIIGSASVHDNDAFRKEVFLERDVVETPRGLKEGIYHSFGGVAVDLPVDDRNSFTVLAGLQEFSGRNVRLHARANYVHILKPELGLSAQLRTRFFRSSVPHEYDYYSPRWYLQVIPVLQLRRYSGGWRYMVAGGIGAQRDANSDWRASYYIAGEVTSPQVGRNWFFKASAQYSNIPQNSGAYDYGQLTIGLTKTF